MNIEMILFENLLLLWRENIHKSMSYRWINNKIRKAPECLLKIVYYFENSLPVMEGATLFKWEGNLFPNIPRNGKTEIIQLNNRDITIIKDMISYESTCKVILMDHYVNGKDLCRWP